MLTEEAFWPLPFPLFIIVEGALGVTTFPGGAMYRNVELSSQFEHMVIFITIGAAWPAKLCIIKRKRCTY